MRTSIYVLRDPRTGVPRYVGKTGNLVQRLNQYLKPAFSSFSHNRDMFRWLLELKGQGLKVLIDVVAVDTGKADDNPEKEWIHRFRNAGAMLFNKQMLWSDLVDDDFDALQVGTWPRHTWAGDEAKC